MKRLRDIIAEETVHLSLLEARWGIPGTNKGYIDHEKIDGHDVHVVYKHHGGGHYSAGLLVNGKYQKTSGRKTTPTDVRIARFTKTSVENFHRDIKPVKFTLRGNSPEKAELYRKWAHYQSGQVKDVRRGAVISQPENKSAHTPSGTVPRTPDNPANSLPRRGKKEEMKGSKDPFKKKWKGSMKSGKMDFKGAKLGGKGAKAAKA